MKLSRLFTLVYVLTGWCCALLVFFVFSNYLKIGDAARYLDGKSYLAPLWFLKSTPFMDTLVHTIVILLGKVPAIIVISSISGFSIINYIKVFQHYSEKKYYILLFFLPTVLVFGFIPGKEVFLNFFLSVLLRHCVLRDQKTSILLLALYGLLVFKAQYLFSVVLLYIAFWHSITLKMTVSFLLFSISILIVALNFELVTAFVRVIPTHFSDDGSFTRNTSAWDTDFGFFLNAPQGLYTSLVTVYPSEILQSPIIFVFFVEGMFVSVFLFYALCRWVAAIGSKRFYVRPFLLLLSLVLLLLSAYPLSFFNTGSGLRYKSGYLIYLISLILIMVYSMRPVR